RVVRADLARRPYPQPPPVTHGLLTLCVVTTIGPQRQRGQDADIPAAGSRHSRWTRRRRGPTSGNSYVRDVCAGSCSLPPLPLPPVAVAALRAVGWASSHRTT